MAGALVRGGFSWRGAGPRLAGGLWVAGRVGLFTAACRYRRSGSGLTAGSASCHRATPGGPAFHTGRVLAQAGEVGRGVEVAVVCGAAALTRPGPFGQGQAWLSPAARRTGLRAGIPPVRDDQGRAVPGGLVAELAPQLGRGGVGHHPVEPAPALACAGLAAGPDTPRGGPCPAQPAA